VNATWRRKFNKELQDELGIQWLEHAMRRSEDDISRTVLNWKPMGKDLKGDPGKCGLMLWKKG